jgi:hypothetical protein
MITAEQEKQITDYLIFEKLPLDILLEVKDHMISQILDIQLNENMSFDEAFHKTKILWQSEFKMTHYYAFYTEKIPAIVKKIAKAKNNGMLKKALLLGFISLCINILLIYISNSAETYTTLFTIQNSLFVIIPVAVLAFNYKIRKYIKTNFKYKGKSFYTVYQKNMGFFTGGMIAIFQIISAGGKHNYLFFKTGDTAKMGSDIMSLFFPFVIQTMIIFSVISFLEHKKALIKLQDYLKTAD